MTGSTNGVSSDMPARRKLYIHIGAYKTGTTSIQYLLNHNRPHLHGYGVYYPSTGRHPRAHVQHALLAQAFLEDLQIDPDRQLSGFGLQNGIDRDLLARTLRHEIDISGCHTAILSSEVFYGIPEPNIRALFSYFPDFDIIPILYIRNLVDMAETFYQTALVHGNLSCTFDEYRFDEGVRVDLHDLCREWADGAHRGKTFTPIHGNFVRIGHSLGTH
jgi:capsular polysaccharide export protein